MINVNLRPGTKRKGKSGPSFKFNLDAFKGLGSSIKDPLRLTAVLAWVAAGAFLGWMYISTAAQLSDLEPRLEETRAEHRRFQDFLAQKRKAEMARDSILSQITTIRQVDGDRYVWAHIMNEVAQALPPFTWLVNISNLAPAPVPAQDEDSAAAAPKGPPPVQVQVTGRTVDIQGYTRFMRQLEDSPWLENITAVSANTVVELGKPVTAFVLTATFSRPSDDRIQTVPIAESVR